jgi:hypothetical protein
MHWKVQRGGRMVARGLPIPLMNRLLPDGVRVATSLERERTRQEKGASGHAPHAMSQVRMIATTCVMQGA